MPRGAKAFRGYFFVQKKESPVIEFFPQRWFSLGLLISGTTLLACIGYLGYDFFRRRRAKRVRPLADSTV